MYPPAPQQALKTSQQNLCEYGGAFGVMLTLTCLIQHLIVTKSHWITSLMLVEYFFAVVVFLLFALKKSYSPVLIIISTVFSLAVQLVWMRQFAFSLVVVCLFVYHIVLLVFIYTEEIPAALKRRRMAEIEEEMKWADKI
jgi:hypothetical protein